MFTAEVCRQKCGCVKRGELCKYYAQIKITYSKLKSASQQIIDELVSQGLI